MKHLSDQQLLGELKTLRNREAKTTLAVLRYLDEVERRKLHLKLGYSSLFAFATQHLRYSESAAGRRIQAARCLRRYPEVGGLLLRHEVNLSTITTVSGILDDSNKDALLARIRNLPQREVEAIAEATKPAKRVPDRIKPVNVPVSRASLDRAPVGQSLGIPNSSNHSRSGSGSGTVSLASASGATKGSVTESATVDTTQDAIGDGEAAVEPQFKVEFAARRAFMEKFEAARALLSGRFPKGVPFAAVFDAALDAFLEKKSPSRHKARREQREAQRRAQQAIQEKASRKTQGATRRGPDNAKGLDERRKGVKRAGRRSDPGGQRARRVHVPVAVRDAVFECDAGCCTYVGRNGRRCNATHDVDVDHNIPVARGGTNALENLRLLCAQHNQLEAERIYGTTWMQRFH